MAAAKKGGLIKSDGAGIMAAALVKLKKHYGYAAFRPAQGDAIVPLMNGQDVLAVLSTGYGKSCLFQIPALMSSGTALIVSPLIALMKDQVDDCEKRNIPASFVNSHISPAEASLRIEGLIKGLYKVFYVAPERFKNPSFLSALKKTNISIIGIDEAHCCSRWGHDFRPDYQRVKDIIPILMDAGKRPPIIAVTATATRYVEEDIIKGCGMQVGKYVRVVGDPVRSNLNYHVIGDGDVGMEAALRKLAATFNIETGRYVIYAGTRELSEEIKNNIQDYLEFDGKVDFYHAGLTKRERERAQDNFKSGETPIMVATCAFGMGIDVPNIRMVVHYGIPGSLEDYCQESGRAGRDGKPSDVVLLFSPKSVRLRERFIASANPDYFVYENLWEWLHDQLEEGEILFQTGTEIADALVNRYGGNLNAWNVSGALSTMEAYGLIRRANASSGGMSLRVEHEALKAVADNSAKHMPVIKVAKYMYDYVVEPEIRDGRDFVSVIFNKLDCAEGLKLNEQIIAKCVDSLRKKQKVLEVNASFRGKTTEIREYGAKLSDVLPPQLVHQKLARELDRLEQMKEYCTVKDKRDYIRQYFLKGGK